MTSDDLEAARQIQLEDAEDAVWDASDELQAIGVELTAASVSRASNTRTASVEGDQDAARAVLAELLPVEFAVRGPTRVAQTGTG